MKTKRVRYKLSPNEETQLIKEETDKRKRLRLLQVREQSKANAARVRQAVRSEKFKQLQKLADQITDEFEKEKAMKLAELESKFESCLVNIGKGQKEASECEDYGLQKMNAMKENVRKAAGRHNAALEKLQANKVVKYMKENKHILARKDVLEKERERAAKIAALPPPLPNPLDQVAKPGFFTQVKDQDYLKYRFYLPPDCFVEKNETDMQPNALAAADEEERRLTEQQDAERKLVHERLERARLRHKSAIEKEQLKQESQKMLLELSYMRKTELRQRQRKLANIPKRVFLPPHKRLEDKEDRQKMMEVDFEDLFTTNLDLKGNYSVLLEPQPLPDMPVTTDLLDVTLSPKSGAVPSSQQTLPVLKDVTNVSVLTPTKESPSQKSSRLKELFQCIKTQRDEWFSRSEHTISIPGSKVPKQIATDEKEEDNAMPKTEDLDLPVGVNEETVVQNTCGSNALLHPLEIAAQVREQMNAPGKEDCLNLDEEQEPTVRNSISTQLQELLEQKRRIEEQKQLLEERLKEYDRTQSNVHDLRAKQPSSQAPAKAAPSSFSEKTEESGATPLPSYSSTTQLTPAAVVTQTASDQGNLYDRPLSTKGKESSGIRLEQDAQNDSVLPNCGPAAECYHNEPAFNKRTFAEEKVRLSKIREFQEKMLERLEQRKACLKEIRAGIQTRQHQINGKFSSLEVVGTHSLEMPSSLSLHVDANGANLLTYNQAGDQWMPETVTNVVQETGTTAKPSESQINKPEFSPTLAEDNLECGSIPRSELQVIKKFLPFDEDEALDDLARIMPSHMEDASTSANSQQPVSNDAFMELVQKRQQLSQEQHVKLKQQLCEVKKQKDEIFNRIKENHRQFQMRHMKFDILRTLVENEEQTDESLGQVTGRTENFKMHPPLRSSAFVSGHIPHELSAIQEADSTLHSQISGDLYRRLSSASAMRTSLYQMVSPLAGAETGNEVKYKSKVEVIKGEPTTLKSDAETLIQDDNYKDPTETAASPLSEYSCLKDSLDDDILREKYSDLVLMGETETPAGRLSTDVDGQIEAVVDNSWAAYLSLDISRKSSKTTDNDDVEKTLLGSSVSRKDAEVCGADAAWKKGPNTLACDSFVVQQKNYAGGDHVTPQASKTETWQKLFTRQGMAMNNSGISLSCHSLSNQMDASQCVNSISKLSPHTLSSYSLSSASLIDAGHREILSVSTSQPIFSCYSLRSSFSSSSQSPSASEMMPSKSDSFEDQEDSSQKSSSCDTPFLLDKFRNQETFLGLLSSPLPKAVHKAAPSHAISSTMSTKSALPPFIAIPSKPDVGERSLTLNHSVKDFSQAGSNPLEQCLQSHTVTAQFSCAAKELSNNSTPKVLPVLEKFVQHPKAAVMKQENQIGPSLPFVLLETPQEQDEMVKTKENLGLKMDLKNEVVSMETDDKMYSRISNFELQDYDAIPRREPLINPPSFFHHLTQNEAASNNFQLSEHSISSHLDLRNPSTKQIAAPLSQHGSSESSPTLSTEVGFSNILDTIYSLPGASQLVTDDKLKESLNDMASLDKFFIFPPSSNSLSLENLDASCGMSRYSQVDLQQKQLSKQSALLSKVPCSVSTGFFPDSSAANLNAHTSANGDLQRLSPGTSPQSSSTDVWLSSAVSETVVQSLDGRILADRNVHRGATSSPQSLLTAVDKNQSLDGVLPDSNSIKNASPVLSAVSEEGGRKANQTVEVEGETTDDPVQECLKSDRQSSNSERVILDKYSVFRQLDDGCPGITEEPEPSLVSVGSESTLASDSVISFEKHEKSCVTTLQYGSREEIDNVTSSPTEKTEGEKMEQMASAKSSILKTMVVSERSPTHLIHSTPVTIASKFVVRNLITKLQNQHEKSSDAPVEDGQKFSHTIHIERSPRQQIVQSQQVTRANKKMAETLAAWKKSRNLKTSTKIRQQ